MIETFFAGPAPWFTAPALLATGLLLVQLAMGEFGGDLDADLPEPGADAQWLSVQTVSAFFVGFGWIGLAALRLFDLSFGTAALVGVVAGLGVSWMMVQATRSLLRLQSDANVNLADAVGLQGSVAVMIPPAGGGSGRVTLVINGAQHELPASQTGTEAIHTHAAVRVTRADDASGAVTVEPA